MTIKQCTCGLTLTTKKSKKLGRMTMANETLLLINCLSCNSTIAIKNKVKK